MLNVGTDSFFLSMTQSWLILLGVWADKVKSSFQWGLLRFKSVAWLGFGLLMGLMVTDCLIKVFVLKDGALLLKQAQWVSAYLFLAYCMAGMIEDIFVGHTLRLEPHCKRSQFGVESHMTEKGGQSC